MGTSLSTKDQKRILTRATRRTGKQELNLLVADAIEERVEKAQQLSDRMLMLHGTNPVTFASYTFEEYTKVVTVLEQTLTPDEWDIVRITYWAIDYYTDLANDLAAMDEAWFQNLASPAGVAA